MRVPLAAKLAAGFAAPTLVFFGVFAWLTYDFARSELDAALGQRLLATATGAAAQVRGKYLVPAAPGEFDERALANTQRKLATLSTDSGARLYIIDANFIALADSANQFPLGQRVYQAEMHRLEVARALTAGVPAVAPTFVGAGGLSYKTGYAPVRASESEPEVVLALAAEAPADYFAQLRELRRTLLWLGLALAALSIAAASITAYMLTRKLHRLGEAARQIGGGDLAHPIATEGHDEVGDLARIMEQMRQGVADRDAQMQQMVAGIAHEVRNPLAGMSLFAGLLRDEVSTEAGRSHVQRIERELSYLEKVVNDFLAFARRVPIERAWLAAEALVRDTLAVCQHADRVVVNVVPREVLVDAAQFRRVILNLVQNALDASPSPAQIRVTLTGAPDLQLEVANPGPEIPAEIRGRMFEPFFSTKQQGTGLGLGLAQAVVRAHGGSLTVTRRDEHNVFVVQIPDAAR